MTYHLELFPVGLAVGLLLVAGHLPVFLAPGPTANFLRQFPRSLVLGRLLLAVAVAWTLWLVLSIDLGEFAPMRNLLFVGVLVVGVLTWIFLEEFLAVRALAICLLLAAEILLSSAFLQPPVSRLLLVVLAYGWILAGLFWVGLPWLLRDQIDWLVRAPWRLRVAAGAGIAYGLAILLAAALFWRG